MATTACTDNHYETVIEGATGYDSDGGVVITYKTPKPVWTDSNSTIALQCNSVAIGGFNGLNS
jgi:hypothetical protein